MSAKLLWIMIICATCIACDNKLAPADERATVDSGAARALSDALSHEYANFRKRQIGEVDYRLSVVLSKDETVFSGRVVIDFDLVPNNSEAITLDYDSGEINAITVNGTQVTADYKRWFLTLPSELFHDGRNQIVIDYRRPYATDGSGLHRFVDPETNEVYLYTDFEPYDANRLFPHFDQPNIKARYSLDVTAPENWVVISSTREERIEKIAATTNEPLKHWFFPQSVKMSSYIFSLHAGPYHQWQDTAGDIPLRLFARQSIAKYVKVDDWFTPTRQSFAFFEDYFSIAYPFVKYDQIIVPDFNAGAMENIGAVTFSERYVSRGKKTTAQRQRLANTIAHEMAHMWFGDLVTMDWWNGLWLNESFATYMAYLEMANASDFENTWDTFYSSTKRWAYRTDQQVTTHAIELPVPTTADAFTNFDGITYGKGASVLKQLPYFLGEDAFRKGVSNYLKKHSYKNTSLDDFMDELGAAANMDLTQWTQQWLYEAGLNTIQAQYTCNDNQLQSLSIRQKVPKEWPTLRQQRIQIGLYRKQGSGMSLTERLPVTYSGDLTQVNLEGKSFACPDFIYPNLDDWAYAKVLFDARSLATLKENINGFTSSALRLMLWQNLWDGVRDIDIALTDYVDFVIANIPAENDDKVLLQVSDSLVSSYRFLTSIESSDLGLSNPSMTTNNIKSAMEIFSWQQLKQAVPASDAQKIWFNTLLAVTHSDEGVARLLSLLEGEIKLPSLVIDQDMRWQLIVKLNQYQYPGHKALVDKEKALDNSDLGVKMSIVAEVIRPDAAIKQRWLNTIVKTPELQAKGEPTIKLATLRLAMASMFPAEQLALMTPHVEKLLAVVPQLSDSADQGYLRAFARYMAPAQCSMASVQRLQQANQQFQGLNPAVSKAYRIAEQEDSRCVNIASLIESK